MTTDKETISQTVPDAEALGRASQLKIWDETGKQVEFGSVFADKRTIVVFIRHFFCGICQGYVKALGQVSEDDLRSANLKIVVIGCGEWHLIENYKKTTSCGHSIYADDSRTLYRALGMTVETLKGTPADEKPKSYVPANMLGNALRSIWGGLQHPSHIGKQGNFSQLGGDFVLGPGLTCSFAHRMVHTQDHVEVEDLLKAAGMHTP
ncbi:hypothetical protein SISSUDRAFT_1039573 [Sistotremastrum suecicum HHB10207 ss-3]|uniref:AhpC-TSA-domain-containing protein n=1 Tax=Sistotremastrum suecicum HHB10207 ss-3 TaxID=1314776 RepID=A0A166IFK2_9AGAM|nr:hypothetical protein SISSUDRAFT_1039573 [Sistotremastrum suecicum HHB10207 ss-3]